MEIYFIMLTGQPQKLSAFCSPFEIALLKTVSDTGFDTVGFLLFLI